MPAPRSSSLHHPRLANKRHTTGASIAHRICLPALASFAPWRIGASTGTRCFPARASLTVSAASAASPPRARLAHRIPTPKMPRTHAAPRAPRTCTPDRRRVVHRASAGFVPDSPPANWDDPRRMSARVGARAEAGTEHAADARADVRQRRESVLRLRTLRRQVNEACRGARVRVSEANTGTICGAGPRLAGTLLHQRKGGKGKEGDAILVQRNHPLQTLELIVIQPGA
ncbi:hypothetical protein DFH09DRAFT_1115359 [Mycena vulgaris]|nr:hypothetical protein DFH09DRAFT_1115359 [Mycena vulgaris]